MKSLSHGILLRETKQISNSDFKSDYCQHNFLSLSSHHYLRKKISDSFILEIVATQNLIFIINTSMKCICINKLDLSVLFELTHLNERSRTIFYNKHQDSVILVFIQEHNSEERLKCKSYALSSLENSQIKGLELFPQEDLRVPGFLEFDDLNKLIMTRSASTFAFKFWKLEDYSLLYTISDPAVEEIRLTTEVCLLVHTPSTNSIFCKLCDVDKGTLLNAYEISIKPHRLIELLELFGSYLLIKQFGEPLLILNLIDKTKVIIPGFYSPQNFVYLHEKKLFLALRNCVIEVWNFNGKLLKIFNAPIYSGSGGFIPSRMYITKRQDLIMVSCIVKSRPLGRNAAESTQKPVIKIFRLSDGELITEIKDNPILNNLSTLTFDESFGAIYLGHADGHVSWFNN